MDHAPDVVGQTAVRVGNIGPRSTMRISAFSSNRRRRAAHDAPPATPPTMMTFMVPFFAFLLRRIDWVSVFMLGIWLISHASVNFSRPPQALPDSGRCSGQQLRRLRHTPGARVNSWLARISLQCSEPKLAAKATFSSSSGRARAGRRRKPRHRVLPARGRRQKVEGPRPESGGTNHLMPGMKHGLGTVEPVRRTP